MDPKQIIRIVLICGMLLTGSINTLAKVKESTGDEEKLVVFMALISVLLHKKKWQNDCQAVGLDGKVQNFDQPW